MIVFYEEINKIKRFRGVVLRSKLYQNIHESRENPGVISIDLRLKRKSIGREFATLR